MRLRFGFALVASGLLLVAQPAWAAQIEGLPNSALTPGAINASVTQSDIKSTICVSGWTKTIRPPVTYTNALKKKQLASGYNLMGDLNPSNYEEDHLVPLEVGGNPRGVQNLWPEPRFGSMGASVKDKLENQVRALVCAGKITLAAGQQIFKTDWEQGYTQTPRTPAPTETASTAVTESPSTTPSPVSTTQKIVHAGSYCSIAGDTGVTNAGTAMTCKTSATDTRLRWRS